MMKPIRAFLGIGGGAALVALSLIPPAARAGTAPSAAALTFEIRTKGALAVVRRLDATRADDRGNAWTDVTERIWNGDPAYIRIAPQLAPGTDAGTAEDLTLSLAHALPLSPAAALIAIQAIHGPGLNGSGVCEAPFIENTVDDIPAYIRAATRAVRTVSDPRLRVVRDACLRGLAGAGTRPR